MSATAASPRLVAGTASPWPRASRRPVDVPSRSRAVVAAAPAPSAPATISPAPARQPMPRLFRTLRSPIAGWLRTGRAWLARQRERRELASLDDRHLVDIGCRRADAWQEARKPFWNS